MGSGGSPIWKVGSWGWPDATSPRRRGSLLPPPPELDVLREPKAQGDRQEGRHPGEILGPAPRDPARGSQGPPRTHRPDRRLRRREPVQDLRRGSGDRPFVEEPRLGPVLRLPLPPDAHHLPPLNRAGRPLRSPRPVRPVRVRYRPAPAPDGRDDPPAV